MGREGKATQKEGESQEEQPISAVRWKHSKFKDSNCQPAMQASASTTTGFWNTKAAGRSPHSKSTMK